MSGGSYDYVSFKIEELADSLRNTDSDPRRCAFQKLLRLVAKAAHDIEWVDSCDSGPGDEHRAIDDVFEFLKADPKTLIKAESYDRLAEKLRRYLDLGESQ